MTEAVCVRTKAFSGRIWLWHCIFQRVCLKWHIYPMLIHTVLHDCLRTDCGLTWTLCIYPVIIFNVSVSWCRCPPHEQIQAELTSRLLVLTALLHTNTHRHLKSSRKSCTPFILSQLMTLQTWGPYCWFESKPVGEMKPTQISWEIFQVGVII